MKSAGSGATLGASRIARGCVRDTPRKLVQTAGDLPALSYPSASPARHIRSQVIKDLAAQRSLKRIVLEAVLIENRADNPRKETL